VPNSAIGETDVTTGRQFWVDPGGTGAREPVNGSQNPVEAVRRVIDALDDGEYAYEADSGAVIRARADRDNRCATVDFTGTSDQPDSNFNAPYAALGVQAEGAPVVGPGDGRVIETPGGGYGPPSSHPHQAGEETDDLRAF
jgi:N-methylhydantoinase B/oxoprolinase/acetone carboxylase alpha subunit